MNVFSISCSIIETQILRIIKIMNLIPDYNNYQDEGDGDGKAIIQFKL